MFIAANTRRPAMYMRRQKVVNILELYFSKYYQVQTYVAGFPRAGHI